jgi:hypothetical protein
LRSPRDSGPSFARSSATYSSAPSSRRASGRFSAISTTQRITNIASTIGSAVRTHSKNEIVVSVSFSMNSRPIRFGGLPIGVSRPPTLAP